MKVYSAKTILQAACYDAQRLMHENQTELAAVIIQKALFKLEKIENTPYLKLRWD